MRSGEGVKCEEEKKGKREGRETGQGTLSLCLAT